MNDKIKKILVDDFLIENKLEYNLGNILIKNVKVQPILYYTNNFFDTNINKQQFILFNKDLKDILKNEIKLDYNLIKSLIENQNINLLRDLKDKILIEYYKIQDLKEYIQQNKINNNKYKYQDFCDNYNYHLEEELKKIQNHKNIFKYYDHLVCTFIYYYENKNRINLNTDDYINDDLSDNFDENDDLNELFRKIENNNLLIEKYTNIQTDGNISRKGKFDNENRLLVFGEKNYESNSQSEKGEFDKNEELLIGEKDELFIFIFKKGKFKENKLIFGKKFDYITTTEEIGRFNENEILVFGERIYADKEERGTFSNDKLDFGERIYKNDNKIERGIFSNDILDFGKRIYNDINRKIEKGSFNSNSDLHEGIRFNDNNIEYINVSSIDELNNKLYYDSKALDNLLNKIENMNLRTIISPVKEDELSEIKQYSKTNIIKEIKKEFKKMSDIKLKRNVINFEKMLIESNDVEDDSNPQLKLEFDTICLSIDLVVGNMYSKLLKRFLLEYLIEKYLSEVDQKDDLIKLKNIIKNIMIRVDNLINIKYEEDEPEPTEFTKKLVILHSEGRYKIKNYVDLDEDNLFNEIVNLLKSNPYEKIEEDDIILTYLKDNINDYFKKFYKIAINTLIACSSGINNYILYHNKYKKIVSFLDGIIESKINKFNEDKKNEEDKKENRKII